MITQGIHDQILLRAMKDPVFREEMIRSPRAVLQRDYAINIPDKVAIKVIEDTPATMTIALPPPLSKVVQELDDTELKKAAGVHTEQIKITWTAICSSDGPCSVA